MMAICWLNARYDLANFISTGLQPAFNSKFVVPFGKLRTSELPFRMLSKRESLHAASVIKHSDLFYVQLSFLALQLKFQIQTQVQVRIGNKDMVKKVPLDQIELVG